MEAANFWYQLVGAVVCVLCAAFAAGLTVGLMSLDPLELEVKRRVGTPDERKHAEKICPLIARHHRLLVTLLLFNSIANEALPIFLSGLVPGYVAVLLSVTAILIFGEIIPSALFTGPNQIVMAARFSGCVLFLMGLFWPIAYPIAHVLDKWLGHNSFKRYTREELSTLVDLQREAGTIKHRRPPGTPGGGMGTGAYAHSAKEKELGESMRAITVDEATIVAGVLKCHAKKICDALKPMDEVYTLCEDDVLDENMLCDIMACGFSRIPVHSARGRQDIRGFLLVKRLIVLDPADRRPVRTLPLRQPIVVSPTGSLLELINVFQEGRSHMAIVSSCPDLTRQALRTGKALEGRIAPIGIITLEDLFEEILQEEIYDEHDDRVCGFLVLAMVTIPFPLSSLSPCPPPFLNIILSSRLLFDPLLPMYSRLLKERKAIETLKRVRRKVRRLRQQQQEELERSGHHHQVISVASSTSSGLSNQSPTSSPTSTLSGGALSPTTTAAFLLLNSGVPTSSSASGEAHAAPASDDPTTSLLSSTSRSNRIQPPSSKKTDGSSITSSSSSSSKKKTTKQQQAGSSALDNGNAKGNGHPPTSYGSTDATDSPV